MAPDLPGAKHHHVEVRGARLHAVEVGAGDGPPIVLVHGWPQTWWAWREVMTGLRDHARVIAVDNRGFGDSDATPRGYRKDELAQDLLGVLDALDVRRAHLVGHDWGGVIGFLACLRDPGRFERYVALNTGHPWPKPDGKLLLHGWRFAYQWILASPGLGTRAAASRRFLKLLLAMGTTKRAPVFAALDVYHANLRQPARAKATQQLYRTFQVELSEWLRGTYKGQRLTMPVLWLHGMGDIALRPHLIEGIADHADDVRVEYVDGSGHFICEEAPDVVTARIREFCGI